MQDSNAGNSVALGQPDAVAVASGPHWLTPIGGDTFTSLDLSTPQGRIDLAEAVIGQPDKLADWINREVSIRDVFIAPASKEDPETGEISFFTKIVLYTVDGQRIFCGSKGVLKSLEVAAFIMGRPPWPGLKCTIRRPQSDGWVILDWDRSQWNQTTPTDNGSYATAGGRNESAKKKSTPVK